MNKKGEVTLLVGIIVGFIIAGVSTAIINDKLKDINDEKIVKGDAIYIGDSSTGTAYNIMSDNPNCNLNDVSIDSQNFVHLKTKDELKGYRIDPNCN